MDLDEDSKKLIDQFGVSLIDMDMIKKTRINEIKFFRRGIIFGHQDLELIIKAIEEKSPWAVMSGIKPSGSFHIGSFMTASEIIALQKIGARAFYCIADIESWEDNGIPFEESLDNSVDNLADVLALGLDLKNAYIWCQSKEEIVKKVPYIISRYVTNNMMRGIYGDKSFGMYLANLVQVGDILLPQIKDGPMPTIIPVGIDQAPHLRLTRDLTKKHSGDFVLPSASFHFLLSGLDGSPKMSKRFPNSYFTFNEPLKSIKKKIMNAFTGGRDTVQEQREKGGIPEICMVFKLEYFLFVEDDDYLSDCYKKCKAGEMLCGEHKKKCVEIITKFIQEHEKKKEKNIDKARE
ncbi:MAG: tryptophan--tRNA ligase, partial [Candidatus Helarchaeota archaeon]